jgi:hypothetical protein
MATTKCRRCGWDVDWLGRCKLERATRPRAPRELIMLMVVVLLTGCATVDIEPRPIPEALEQWARQTGYQIVVPAERGCERSSARAKGKDAIAALDQMLKGTGLTYRWINRRTVAIVCP